MKSVQIPLTDFTVIRGQFFGMVVLFGTIFLENGAKSVRIRLTDIAAFYGKTFCMEVFWPFSLQKQ